MSKKDKSKFHRRLRAEILKQMENRSVRPETTISKPQETAPEPAIQPSLPGKIEISNVPPVAPLTASNNTTMFVNNDLKKSALIIGSIIVLIVLLYFIDLKTGILLNISNLMFKLLHLAV